ncbi:hypothetical protein AAHA92_13563 [Salvia divinorum]|uniref:Late embryogenesis abundant protein LEA-2 subgroup domain-containing protein n=1 Tax=Salvia divinorum TaxID=28513 RepID=A0ABD1H8R4_SALDI
MGAEKEQQSPHPLAPAYAYPRSVDAEAGAATHDGAELRKKKRAKCLVYVFAFAIFQFAVIAVFALTVMKVKTPKFRIQEATLSDFTAGAASLRATLGAELAVKNANFGPYKYRSTTVEFFYRGAKIGEVLVPASKANWRTTKEISAAAVELDLSGDPQLSGGVARITSSAKMEGKVEMMFVMKKDRSTEMNCSMDIVTASRSVENIECE